MRFKHFAVILFVLSIAFLSGCATQKHWTATGGSRSDGIIKLSYEYGLFEKPDITLSQGSSLAKNRCASWGYNNAEAFGGTIKQCTSYGSYGCERWLVTAEYQCTNVARSSAERSGSALTPTLPPKQNNPLFAQELKPGKGYYQAEKIANTLGCDVPLDILKNEGNSEVYQANCSNGKSTLISCEWGSCKVVK
jgi:hypothetical protein